MKNFRINFILFCIFLFSAVIVSRLFYIQIANYEYYKALAFGQQKIFNQTQGERGEILFGDRKGNLRFIAKNIEQDNVLKRYYPQEFLASQIIGFMGGEGAGQYGLEGYYDDVLKGEEKFFEQERNPWIGFFSANKNAPTKGVDFVLSLDYNIQSKAKRLLENAREKFNIEAGEIIVMDPMSGKILAMANFPNFNPNNYSSEKDFEIFQNSATQKIFEPGSVFKAITMAAAIDQNKITPQTEYVDKGFEKIDNYVISNYNDKVYGKRNMIEVLEKSINTGAIFAERTMGDKIFLEYIERFGFFEPTGVDLQNEVFSKNKELKKGYKTSFATASFGHGIEVTPIQLAVAYSAIANGGKLVKPYIAEKKIFENNRTIETETEIIKDNVISVKTASQLTAMLTRVIENSYVDKAKIPGYYLAGKTGTSQMAFSAINIHKKGYSDKTWQTFIGFGPSFDPKFLILVKLDNPNTKTAEYSAVPVFKDLAKYIIDYLEIPPDYE
ncbi:MAG: penicillin-binding protein 2 [Patescibacteria group bacterium]|nr:penicillin-binding protein 2 [Patescibacteria group bacterium]